jgi:hypothetical protein
MRRRDIREKKRQLIENWINSIDLKKNIYTIYVNHGMRSMYKFYKKELEPNVEDAKKCYEAEYAKIIRDYMEMVKDDLIFKGHPIFLFSLGWITVERVTKTKSSVFKIDWHKTKKVGKVQKRVNFYSWRIIWIKQKKVKNLTKYYFRPHRKFVLRMIRAVYNKNLKLSGLTRQVYKIQGSSQNEY